MMWLNHRKKGENKDTKKKERKRKWRQKRNTGIVQQATQVFPYDFCFKNVPFSFSRGKDRVEIKIQH